MKYIYSKVINISQYLNKKSTSIYKSKQEDPFLHTPTNPEYYQSFNFRKTESLN